MSSKLGKIRTETRSWRGLSAIIFGICVISTGPDSWTITIEQNVHFQVGIYHENLNFIKFKMAELRPLPIDKFSRIHSAFFYILLQNLCHISISLISRTSSKLGKIRTETRSWRTRWPIISHYFSNIRNSK